MPDESRVFIEGECLRVARLQPGCEQLKAILIARTRAPNERSNWKVLGFHPELPPTIRAQAIKAIEILRDQYVLAPAPMVKPTRKKAEK
jgi:hypothetical protein